MNTKTASQPAVITPTIVVLALLAAAVVYIGASGSHLPFLGSLNTDIVLLVLLGMAICALGGIGRVAAARQWSHPLSILGYVLGGLILLIAAAALIGWKLPLIQDSRQALIAIALLIGLKMLNSVAHSLLTHS